MLSKKEKSNNGITLVALVITIIILLILSSITLNTLIGKKGIIRNAQISKNEYEVSVVKEKLSLWYIENTATGKDAEPVDKAVDLNNVKDKSTLETIVKFQNEAETIDEINFSDLYYLDLEKLGLKNSVKENRYFMDINTKLVYVNEGIELAKGRTYILEEKEILPIVLNAEETDTGFKLIISLNSNYKNIEEY